MKPDLASVLAHALLQFVWEGAAIALLLAFALYVCRPASARVRYGLACVALLAMLAAFGVTLAWFWPHTRTISSVQTMARTAVPAPTLFVRPGPSSASPAPHPLDWIAPLWMLGVILFSLRSVAAWLAAIRLKRTSVAAASAEWQERLARLSAMLLVSRPVRLLESYLADVPMVIGWVKPAILIPASLFTGFPPEHLECILLHELAHIRRHDYLVNLLQSLAEDLLFYHPAVWWVSSVIRAEREHCCDDAVVAARGDGREFAEALAGLEQQRWSVYEAAIAANGGQLMHRIRRLLGAGGARPRLVAPLGFSASVLVAVAAVAVSVGHAQNPPAPSAPAATPAPAAAPAAKTPQPPAAQAASPSTPPTEAPPSRETEEQRLKRELETPYQKWLNEEVFWIITPEERSAFLKLNTDAEREAFIEYFWLKRDPTPSTVENEYREEYYRRVLYANDTFSAKSGIPGWKTDRGMIYIKYGPPDERDEHPSGGAYQRPPEQGGGTTQTYPFEDWRYRFIEGIGNDVVIEFVDPTGKGEYHMTADPAEKDKLLYVPGTGQALAEQLGIGVRTGPASQDQFQRLQAFAALQPPPKPVVAPADAIEAIVFQGAKRFPQELLLNLIPTREGDKLDQDVLDKDVKLLRNTGRFDDVQVRYARGKVGWVVTFTVVETVIERPAPRVDDRVLLK